VLAWPLSPPRKPDKFGCAAPFLDPGDPIERWKQDKSHRYSAMATALGERSGFASSSDDRLRVELSRPDDPGDGTTSGTNPGQLFAAAQAASLLAAISIVAARALGIS
jgi:organic hydroperoxide reductase OsmC/OhrA